jgi:hypothetical protein
LQAAVGYFPLRVALRSPSGQTITIARDEFGANSRDIQRVMNDGMKATPGVP